MTPFMTARIARMADLLGGAYRFHLPPFQRSYVWDKADHAWQLVVDVLQAMQEEAKPPEQRWHFLGYMTLQRPGAGPDVMVVDGHQRLMTVSIIFAILRDLEDDAALRQGLARLIAEPAGPGAEPLWRLTPQDGILTIFRDYVQAAGVTRTAVPDEVDQRLDTSQRNLIEVRDYLAGRLGRMKRDLRRQLAAFLAERCLVSASELESEEDAWRIFTQTHTRGCALAETDTNKAFVLSSSPAERVEEDSETWEMLEAKLGLDRLQMLLALLQLSKEQKVREFTAPLRLAKTWPKEITNGTFIRNVLKPAGLAAIRLLEPNLIRQQLPKHIAEQTVYLRWIAQRELAWLIVALAWFKSWSGNAREEVFFRALKAVSYAMVATGEGAHDRKRVYIDILRSLAQGPDAAIAHMQDNVRERRQDFAKSLSAPTFFPKPYHKPVMFAIEAHMAGSALATEAALMRLDRLCSIEHIYPRNPAAGSNWLESGPRLRREVNCIGNLLIVPSSLNTETDRKDFVDKQQIFAANPVFRMIAEMGESGRGPRWHKAEIQARTALMVQRAMIALDIAEG